MNDTVSSNVRAWKMSDVYSPRGVFCSTTEVGEDTRTIADVSQDVLQYWKRLLREQAETCSPGLSM